MLRVCVNNLMVFHFMPQKDLLLTTITFYLPCVIVIVLILSFNSIFLFKFDSMELRRRQIVQILGNLSIYVALVCLTHIYFGISVSYQ